MPAMECPRCSEVLTTQHEGLFEDILVHECHPCQLMWLPTTSFDRLDDNICVAASRLPWEVDRQRTGLACPVCASGYRARTPLLQRVRLPAEGEPIVACRCDRRWATEQLDNVALCHAGMLESSEWLIGHGPPCTRKTVDLAESFEVVWMRRRSLGHPRVDRWSLHTQDIGKILDCQRQPAPDDRELSRRGKRDVGLWVVGAVNRDDRHRGSGAGRTNEARGARETATSADHEHAGDQRGGGSRFFGGQGIDELRGRHVDPLKKCVGELGHVALLLAPPHAVIASWVTAARNARSRLSCRAPIPATSCCGS